MVETIKPGTYKLITASGQETLFKERPSIDGIHKLIGADALDTVILDRDSMIVMMVDDTGMVDGKPVNAKATDLYHAVRATPYSIHGDVVLVNDMDFA